MGDDFLARLRPLIGDKGISNMREAVVAIAGLGGTGSPAFIHLVRMGVRCFKIAENGVFNEPDINRQVGAFRSTMNKPKIDVYYDMAKDINPDVELELFRDGVPSENLGHFVEGSHIFVRMLNLQKDMVLESTIPKVLEEHNCVCFSSYLLGFGTLVFNYKPGGISVVDALSMVTQGKTERLIGGLLPPFLTQFFSEPVMRRVVAYLEKSGDFPSNAPAAQLAGTLAASEICAYLLQDTDLVTREVVWSPKFITCDLFTMNLRVWDLREFALQNPE